MWGNPPPEMGGNRLKVRLRSEIRDTVFLPASLPPEVRDNAILSHPKRWISLLPCTKSGIFFFPRVADDTSFYRRERSTGRYTGLVEML